MNNKKKRLLLIQETDWILRGPHYHHHIFGRLNFSKYDLRVVDFPLIWDREKRTEYPHFKGFHIIKSKFQINASKSINIYRPFYINLPIFSILSIYFQRIVIKNLIADFKPDIVICFASLLNVNYVNKLCKKNGIPFVYVLLEKYYTLIPFKFLQQISRKLQNKAIQNSSYNVSITKNLKRYTDEICKNMKEKNILIPQGVDLKFFNPNLVALNKKKKLNIKESDIVLFFMGWIYQFSGMKEVAEQIAKHDNHDLKLIIVGEGDIYYELKRFTKINNLENRIILTGRVPYNEIPEYLSLADICLLPAYNNDVMRDLCPAKIYEYLGMGKPVITTKLPGIITEIGYNNGIIYIDNPNQTVDKVLEIINISKQEGKKARKFAEKYDWNVITSLFEKFLNDLFNNKSKIN